MIKEYQYLFVACSAYLGVLEAKTQGKKVPKETFDQAKKLFQSAYVRAGLRFKNIAEPHYTLEEALELVTYFAPTSEVSIELKEIKEDV